MKTKNRKYRGLISSDWNECLAPSRPFDFITFTYPFLEPELKEIFKAYTGNQIPLSEATRRIASLLPATITEEQTDAFLDASFTTYRGVPELIEWCSSKDILFMINTTALRGFFQRAFKKGLLPNVTAVSAHPLIKYKEEGKTTCRWYDLLEIQDKPVNTQKVLREWGIPPDKAMVIGDSGGDGPHFEWGARVGAFLVGSMTKWSLDQYCSERGIEINLHFGPRYSKRENRNEEVEMKIDFMDLSLVIEETLHLR
jgi:phosphoglycolate phosphatase-like HAD superfamily hydrolase